ncbi:hypothetical protein HRW12_18805, partial [Streptomyces lunaelactis]|nr:hypothetical protein [Streptomyces lunaelactis]
PNLGDEAKTILTNIINVSPGSAGQWVLNMANAARNNVPGAIGALTAFAGTFYGPIATAGQAPGAVAHGQPLVGNTHPGGVPPAPPDPPPAT